MGRRRADELARDLGPRLRALRSRAGLTQEQLGVAASIKAESVSRIERGRSCPDVATLARLLDVLGATFGEVLDADVDRTGVSAQELEVLRAWRRLDARRRQLAREVIESLASARPEELLAAEPRDKG